MKKSVIIVSIVLFSLLLCSYSAVAADSVTQAARRMESETPESSPEPTLEVSTQITGETPADETAPELAMESGPAEMPEQERRLVPYTMAWLDRYAPASVAPFEEQVGDNGDYEEITVRPPNDTYKLVVDYHNQCVYAFSKDKRGNFINLERVMICTTGGNGNWTPEGTYNMGGDYHRFGFFTSFNCYAQYWSQMAGSFYFHSLLYTSRDGSSWTRSSYNQLGTPGSHGCIRLLVPDARWIFENCAPGTECVVTTDYEKNQALKTALRKGYEGAIDYVPPGEAKEEGA